ncbi:MAG: helix-turn-helix domain-containing protein [Lachnospiraceae bacterium]|nr:helix-turn-helix domain-containing protein [Lachnospiraceae bacterium]
MINAYDKVYLEKAQTVLGRMIDYAFYDLEYDADCFFELFIVSGFADRFGDGDYTLIVGKSGVELARIVIEKTLGESVRTKPKYEVGRSPEYWAGWALAYYQWLTSLSFREIVSAVPLSEIIAMYSPYHEMDVRQFCDKMTEFYKSKNPETNLKRLRRSGNMTQNELAMQSGIPLRTVQQYEQRQKDINKARAEYLIALSKVLNCSPDDLIEKV